MSRLIIVLASEQKLHCYEGDAHCASYAISTGKNGLGEQMGSERTPRGWHAIYSIIGQDKAVNSVFVAREWTREIYTPELAKQHPGRDWILTRILQLQGLEPGRNQGEGVDSLERFIYIHGTPDETQLGIPGSRGCIRMRNLDIMKLAQWVEIGTLVYIE